MSDELLRDLRRRAIAGDLEARDALRRERARRGLKRPTTWRGALALWRRVRHPHFGKVRVRFDDFGSDPPMMTVEDARTGRPELELEWDEHRTDGPGEWRVLNLDVWGNEEEGYEVNNAYLIGRLPRDVGVDADEQTLLDALISEGYLRENCVLDE